MSTPLYQDNPHTEKSWGGKVHKKGAARRVAMRLAGERFKARNLKSSDGRNTYRKMFSVDKSR